MSTTIEPGQLATKEEIEWLLMGPIDGGIPGLVRRIRRILDVSQRGLAEILEVSQSVVARWETGRTSPRASVLHHLLGLAGIRVGLREKETGKPVAPMRHDGARKHGGNRYPAHTDLRAVGWWVPGHLETTMCAYYDARDLSRKLRDPSVRYAICPHIRRLERLMWGTPDDHPSLKQLAAEAEHLDELREERARRSRAA